MSDSISSIEPLTESIGESIGESVKSVKSVKSIESIEAKESRINDVYEKLYDFFKYKNMYEDQINRHKKKIIENKRLSKKEKRKQYIKLQPKCVICKRPGGTKFATKNIALQGDLQSYKEYSAVCNVIGDTCGLNIKIHITNTEILQDALNEFKDDIKENKNKVIINKNKLLFGCLSDAEVLEKFEELKAELDVDISYYNYYFSEYNKKINNEAEAEELKKTKIEAHKQIELIKEHIAKLNDISETSADAEINIKENTALYVFSLIPLLNKIKDLEYKENTVLFNDENNTFHLIQTKHDIESLTFSTNTHTKVINFNTSANLKIQKKGSKGSKGIARGNVIYLPSLGKKINNDTIPMDEPNYGEGIDGISWNIIEYNNLWKIMSNKLKGALQTNKNWLINFMHDCVNKKYKGEKCVFVSPPDLILPPIDLGNDKYNLGNTVYNYHFNKLSKDQKDYYMNQLNKDSKSNKSKLQKLQKLLNEFIRKQIANNDDFISSNEYDSDDDSEDDVEYKKSENNIKDDSENDDDDDDYEKDERDNDKDDEDEDDEDEDDEDEDDEDEDEERKPRLNLNKHQNQEKIKFDIEELNS